eukprot:680463-Hanusia_phi.AAC.6
MDDAMPRHDQSMIMLPGHGYCAPAARPVTVTVRSRQVTSHRAVFNPVPYSATVTVLRAGVPAGIPGVDGTAPRRPVYGPGKLRCRTVTRRRPPSLEGPGPYGTAGVPRDSECGSEVPTVELRNLELSDCHWDSDRQAPVTVPIRRATLGPTRGKLTLLIILRPSIQ